MTGEHRTTVGVFRMLEMLVHGRVLSVDDLVTDMQERSKGASGVFLDRLVDYARAYGCASIHLDSNVRHAEAHRLYLLKRMVVRRFHGAMPLPTDSSVADVMEA